MVSIQEKIIDIISDEMCIPVEEISAESKLIEDLDADSLDFVELAMRLEEEFDIAFPNEQISDVSTVADAIALVEKKLG